MTNQLKHRVEIDIRFSEVDALGIVWHGHYAKYFEDGREAFGKAFGLDYLGVYKQGFLIPLVNLNINFKRTIKYGGRVIVESTFIDSPAAKIIFNYKIFLVDTHELVATGESTQVFMTPDHELYITIPPFFEAWKKKHLPNRESLNE